MAKLNDQGWIRAVAVLAIGLVGGTILMSPVDAKKVDTALTAYCALVAEPHYSYAPCAGVGESVHLLDNASPNTAAEYTSLAIGADGKPVISYHDEAAGALKVAKCSDVACAGKKTVTTVDDPANDVGLYSSIAVRGDGTPVISYYDSTADALKVASCGDAACKKSTITTVYDPTGVDVGRFSSIVVTKFGGILIAFNNETVDSLMFVMCGDADCATGNSLVTIEDSATNLLGEHISIAIGADDEPVMAYEDQTDGNLKVAKCGHFSCGSIDEISIVDDSANAVGEYTSIAIGTDGNPVISYYDSTADALRVAKCNDPKCFGTDEMISLVDDGNDVGRFSSIAIGRNGNPVIAYQDNTLGTLKFASCNDPACSGSDETIATLDDPNTFAIGRGISAAIGVDGNPVMSYRASLSTQVRVARVSN